MSSYIRDFALNMYHAMRDEINGTVEFEIYEQIDTIIFKTYFKDFTFSYPIKDLSDKIYSCTPVSELVKDFKEEYKRAILTSFFKTERRKTISKTKLNVSRETKECV